MAVGRSAPARNSRALAAPDGTTPPLAGLLAGLRLALHAGNQVAQREALSGVADWPALASLAAHHRVETLLVSGLRTGGVRPPDPEVERTLERRRRRGVRRGMRQLAAMRQLTAAFAARDIPCLFLKGLPLGQRVYGDPFAKCSVDIDLLVPDDAFAAAAGALRELGGRRVMPGFRETPARLRWYDSVENHHVYTGLGSKVELHRRLLGNRFLFDPPFESLHARALDVAVGPDRFRTLGDADQLLYLACHGMVHYWRRLKWLCDFGALLRTMEDGAMEEALARGREARLDTVLGAALLLCRTHLGVETPRAAAVRVDLPRVRFVAGMSRRTWTPRHGLHQTAREVAMRPGRVFSGTGVRYSLDEMRGMLIGRHDFCRIELPDRLFWMYILLLPVLWCLRVLRRARMDAVPAANTGRLHQLANRGGAAPVADRP